MSDASKVQGLSLGQRVVLTLAVGLAVGLAGYGAVGSYTTVADLAAGVGVPLPWLVPIGIDGGLVGVVVLDLVLVWSGSPLGWLRQIARVLTVGTVAANVSAGWPDPIAVGLHAAAPLMLLVMVEAGRAVLLRRIGLASGVVRDLIPLGRWVLSPVRTCLLWRRMVLWQITDYRLALEKEARLQRAHVLLRMRCGRRWRRAAPADLVWMLRSGPFAEEACVRVEDLLVTQEHTATGSALRPGDVVAAAAGADQNGEVGAAGTETDRGDAQFEEVVRINEHHWARCGRPVSAETVRRHLRVGAARARALTNAVRAADIAAVTRKEVVAVE
jgi:hypothetical protein